MHPHGVIESGGDAAKHSLIDKSSRDYAVSLQIICYRLESAILSIAMTSSLLCCPPVCPSLPEKAPRIRSPEEGESSPATITNSSMDLMKPEFPSLFTAVLDFSWPGKWLSRGAKRSGSELANWLFASWNYYDHYFAAPLWTEHLSTCTYTSCKYSNNYSKGKAKRERIESLSLIISDGPPPAIYQIQDSLVALLNHYYKLLWQPLFSVVLLLC